MFTLEAVRRGWTAALDAVRVAEPTRGWVCGVDVVLVVTLVNTSAVISLVVLARRAERQTVPAAGRTQLVAWQAALYIHSTTLRSVSPSREPGFTEAKEDGSGGDNYSYKSCKAPVKSSSPINHHPTSYRPDVLPVTQLAVSKH